MNIFDCRRMFAYAFSHTFFNPSGSWGRILKESMDTEKHKVRTYREYHSVCPSSELGLSQPLSRQRVFPSPKKQGGGGTLVCGWGVGGSPNSDEGHTLWYSLYVRTLWWVWNGNLSSTACSDSFQTMIFLKIIPFRHNRVGGYFVTYI